MARNSVSSMIPADILCAADYERWAMQALAADTFAYIAEGAGEERTLARNRAAFSETVLSPRALVDCGRGSTAIKLLGRRLAHPILLAPVAYQRLVHTQGEIAVAEGAAAADAVMVISTLASTMLESVAAAASAGAWFQLYLQPSRDDSLRLIRRAEVAGCEAIVVTVDAPVTALRYRSQRAGFRMPDQVRAVNLEPSTAPPTALTPHDSAVFQGVMASAPGWQCIEWLCRATELPVLVKGVLDARDAIMAVEAGARGVVVSNHGGRALDGVPASLKVLPQIRAALPPWVPLLVDSGIRSGGDVFKALASGASAVMVGRLQTYALAAAGALGVAHMVRLLKEELEVTMALMGCPAPQDITPDAISQFKPG
ncbi:MAG: alpha-hydroxy-acid oxidizing protein [Gammaproteobacteria bacterium]|nr:alpha-hydroxy-acid oxidizing protein [Gammaproteobacteria bacterium]